MGEAVVLGLGGGVGCAAETLLSTLWLFLLLQLPVATPSPDARRLYDDLLSNYNRLIRPVGNNTDRLTVKMGIKMSQIIGIDMKRQIMITNVWVEQEWIDYKLKWDPADYGGVKHLHVPSNDIWLPDIVLYNNADGNYEVTIMTKAQLHYTGKVVWNPPAIYKSSCDIDVEFFPFDYQECFLKFGSWTYDGFMIDLRHIDQKGENNDIELGMDLQEYYISTEWDVMRANAIRNEKFYPCCAEPFQDIHFYLVLRRKSLFYTVNVIIPCVGISFLSVLVFYLPSDSGEKVSLSISILLSLTVFFLLLAEIIPPTSKSVPLLGKYLLFTMILVTFSVVVTIGVLNVNFRTPATHKMAPWVRKVFVEILPKYLFIKRPEPEEDDGDDLDGMYAPTSPTKPDYLDSYIKSEDSNLLPNAFMSVGEKDMMAFSHAHYDGSYGYTLSPVHHHAAHAAAAHPPHPHHPPPPPHHPHHVGPGGGGFVPPPPGGPGGGPRIGPNGLLPPPPHPPGTPFNGDPGGGPDDLSPLDDDEEDEDESDDLEGDSLGPEDDIDVDGIDGRKFDLVESGRSPSGRGRGGPTTNPAVERAMNALKFVAQHVKNEDNFEGFADDWKYVAMVLDRILLWAFSIACCAGTAGIIMAAPSHYDISKPIDIQYSRIEMKNMMKMEEL